MGLYFGADHLVWAYQIGLISNKTFGERSQKVSCLPACRMLLGPLWCCAIPLQ
jgi:hypothetical protein